MDKCEVTPPSTFRVYINVFIYRSKFSHDGSFILYQYPISKGLHGRFTRPTCFLTTSFQEILHCKLTVFSVDPFLDTMSCVKNFSYLSCLQGFSLIRTIPPPCLFYGLSFLTSSFSLIFVPIYIKSYMTPLEQVIIRSLFVLNLHKGLLVRTPTYLLLDSSSFSTSSLYRSSENVTRSSLDHHCTWSTIVTSNGFYDDEFYIEPPS